VLGIKTNEIVIKGKMREDKLKMESAISQERTQQCSTAFQKLVMLCAKKITFCTLFFFPIPFCFPWLIMQTSFYGDDEPRSIFVFGNPLRFLSRKGRTIGAYLSGGLVNTLRSKKKTIVSCIEIHKYFTKKKKKKKKNSLLLVGGYLLMP
jgi:hypothetical protein